MHGLPPSASGAGPLFEESLGSGTDSAPDTPEFPAPHFQTSESTHGGQAKSFERRRRNRHGRGLRGELLLPTHPGWRTRSDRFDALVMDSADRLCELWGNALDSVQFVVDEIPPQLEELVGTGERAPLSRYVPGVGVEPASITVYRRPIESILSGSEDLAELVHEVIIDKVAEVLNVSPESVDPIYHRTRRL